jgi:hypothetical protein
MIRMFRPLPKWCAERMATVVTNFLVRAARGMNADTFG